MSQTSRNKESLMDLVDSMVTLEVKKVETPHYTLHRNKPRPTGGDKHFDLPMRGNLNAQFDQIFKL